MIQLEKKRFKKSNVVTLQSILATAVVLIPVLGSYTSGLKGITLGDVVLIIAELICFPLFSIIYINKANKLYSVFSLILTLMSTISFVIQGDIHSNAITRVVRIAFYLLSIVIISGTLDYQIIKKYTY